MTDLYFILVVMRSSVLTVCGKRHKTVECPSVRPSVCVSPVDRQQLRWVGRGREQQISIDSSCCCATCGPRKFWSDCKEVQHMDLLVVCLS